MFEIIQGMDLESSVSVDNQMGKDIFKIESKFIRSCVGFRLSYTPARLFTEEQYANQAHLLLRILGSYTFNKVYVKMISFRSKKPLI